MPHPRITSILIGALVFIAPKIGLAGAAPEQGPGNTYEQYIPPKRALVTASDCAPSERLARLAGVVLARYPGLVPPPDRVTVRLDYIICSSPNRQEAHSTVLNWGKEAHSNVMNWGKVVDATLMMRTDVAAQGTLKVLVVLAHELAHIGVDAAGDAAAAGSDGHGYPWLARLIRVGLPSVAFEAVGPGGAQQNYLLAYRRASIDYCARESCGEENNHRSALSTIRE